MAAPSALWVTGEEHGFPRPFGNYLLLASLAQGGMGELFLAMNGDVAGAGRLCVIKKLRPDLTNDREYESRFLDEARVVVQLTHANISHVSDVGRIEGQYYLAMEYVSGVSIKKLMSRSAELKVPIPEPLAIFLVRGMLQALDYAHRHTHPLSGEALHVVHRDVSPQNVLISWEGEVKLIDFGLALSALKNEQTATGAVMGKVAYMSPEQARGEDVEPSCDQFATAVIAYEMLVGERYYGDLPYHAIWAIAGMGNFPPPKWNKVQAEVGFVLQRALHNDKAKRYETCGDLRDALGAYMAAHHPHTSDRTMRELLEGWFKEYRAQERELLSRFKDVTGAAIREAVKHTEDSAESVVSGSFKRPDDLMYARTEVDTIAPSFTVTLEGSGVSSTIPNVSTTTPVFRSSPAGVEPTERVLREATAPARRAMYVAAAVAAAAVVVAVAAIATNGSDEPTAPVGAALVVHEPIAPIAPVAAVATIAIVDAGTLAPVVEVKPVRKGTLPKTVTTAPDERTDKTVAAAVDDKAAAATRARDRIATLKRSGCQHECVDVVVGRFETTPRSVELELFQLTIQNCLDACSKE